MTKLDRAFVTLVTSDAYAMGALVLAHSLRETGTTAQLVVMVTKGGISHVVQNLLQETFDHIEFVDPLDSGDHVNLELLSRPELGITFTKLHCWRLTQYEKAVFLDADTLVLKNVDNLFEYEELSASPDPGWPDCFNSGVFVFRPNEETYSRLLHFALEHGSFDGADQGLLNQFFCDWPTSSTKRLPFVYNCIAQTFYSYAPAVVRFRSQIHIVHFIGNTKPWHCSINSSNGQVVSKEAVASGHSIDHLQVWWNVFLKYVIPAMAEHSEFVSSFRSHLSGGMSHLLGELIPNIQSRQGHVQVVQTNNEEYEWFYSRRWFGEKQHDQTLGFPFLEIQKPHFEPVVDLSFLQPRVRSSEEISILSRTVNYGLSTPTTISCATEEMVTSASHVVSTNEPIIRYFITIGDDDESHMDVISPYEWQSIMRQEGLLQEDDLYEPQQAWSTCETITGRLARLVLPQVDPAIPAPTSATERERQYAWERNEIDYTGSDRFDTILNKITAAIRPPSK